jgi:hypothetical protein
VVSLKKGGDKPLPYILRLITGGFMNKHIILKAVILGVLLVMWAITALAQVDTAWVRRYNGAGNWYDLACGIAVDGSGNVYVSGAIYNGSQTYCDYATIKYVQEEVFVEEDRDDIVSSFVLHQNYPNPFNPQTIIEYSLNFPSDVSLEIFNVKGQLVKTLVDGHREKGFHRVLWDGENDKGGKTSSGIYFYRLKAKDYVEVKKMIKLR